MASYYRAGGDRREPLCDSANSGEPTVWSEPYPEHCGGGGLRKPRPKPELRERAVKKRGTGEATIELRNGVFIEGRRELQTAKSMESSAARACKIMDAATYEACVPGTPYKPA